VQPRRWLSCSDSGGAVELVTISRITFGIAGLDERDSQSSLWAPPSIRIQRTADLKRFQVDLSRPQGWETVTLRSITLERIPLNYSDRLPRYRNVTARSNCSESRTRRSAEHYDVVFWFHPGADSKTARECKSLQLHWYWQICRFDPSVGFNCRRGYL